MKNNSLKLSSEGVLIEGKYKVLSNGFMNKADGTIRLANKDLLSVEFVKARSKRVMYVVLIIGCIFISIFSIFSNSSMNKKIIEKMISYSTQGTNGEGNNDFKLIENEASSIVYQKFKKVIAVVIVLIVGLIITVIVYLFSGRRFVELTTMTGTYRVAVSRDDKEIRRVVEELQGRL